MTISPSEIASKIANDFYRVTSLHNAELRRRIIAVVEVERKVKSEKLKLVRQFLGQLAFLCEPSHMAEIRRAALALLRQTET